MYSAVLSAQLTGKITDEDGISLPFAAIYIDGTSMGTASNEDGIYSLDFPAPGKYIIHCQYVGFQGEKFEINYSGAKIVRDIVLKDDYLFLNEVVITPNKEDPSYPIIREAIKHREENKHNVKSLEANLYVKGMVKMLDAPEKILGEEIGNLSGILDSTRQGILYLSESQSKFYFQEPDKTKEIMISSIKSGDNSLFTANQFNWASFNFYDEYQHFGRSIVSPLADNTFSHYDFKLEKSFKDADDFIIHKIAVIPKKKNSPLLVGYIYIVDGYWAIQAVDLQLYGTALKDTFLDTIEIKQVFIPIETRETWRLFNQSFMFNASLLGFKIGGNFSYIFSDYELNKDLSDVFKNKEVFRVEKDAIVRDTAYWNKTRPVPLTAEEQRDYIKKDSLLTIWNSPEFLDSMDRESNKFSALNVFLGYTRQNSFKNTKLSFPSIIDMVGFNAVEGFYAHFDPEWTKSDSTFRKLSISPEIQYGFSDKKLKPRLSFSYLFDNYTLSKISLSAGRSYDQFDSKKPINTWSNAWSSLWNKNNKIRLYQNDYVSAKFFRELFNGFYMDLTSQYTRRSGLAVNSHYSFRKENKEYEENIPVIDLPSSFYDENSYFQNVVKITLRPGQKYSSYPNYKIRSSTSWPSLTAEYTAGIGLNEDAHDFHKMTFRIRDEYVGMRLLGYFKYNIEGGLFIAGKPSYFADFLHPVGNRISIPIDPDLSSFNLLPFYQYSTDQYYVQFNFRHFFNGFVFDKIPLLRKTPLKLVAGLSTLYVPEKGYYLEPFIGIENFKIGPIHLFDIDYAFSFDKYGFRDHGIVFRLSQLLAN